MKTGRAGRVNAEESRTRGSVNLKDWAGAIGSGT